MAVSRKLVKDHSGKMFLRKNETDLGCTVEVGYTYIQPISIKNVSLCKMFNRKIMVCWCSWVYSRIWIIVISANRIKKTTFFYLPSGYLVGNTNTKHFLHLTKNIYRFSPTVMHPEDLSRFHGVGERISVRNYKEVANFYAHLILGAGRGDVDVDHIHDGL